LHRNKELPVRWDFGAEIDPKIISEISQNATFEGNTDKKFAGVSSLGNANEDDIAFCSEVGTKAHDLISKSQAGVIICYGSLKSSINSEGISNTSRQLVFVDEPRYVFVRLLHKVLSKLGNDFLNDLEPIIGNNCRIGHNVVIGNNCIIEDNCVIHDGTILRNCLVGENSTIHPGVVVGADGFAYERASDAQLLKFPHFAGVILEESVEICANCSITRGSLTNTIIGRGTKLDALVHVAHNVKIGKSCQLAAGTIIGGSASIGDHCWLGLNCTINDHVKIGNHVLVASGAVVAKDIADKEIVAGVPAKSIKDKVHLEDREYFLYVGSDNKERSET
jgi:UDP-3-O-[3-hydroxymyristoyl] glucosamine N-acyltransferase